MSIVSFSCKGLHSKKLYLEVASKVLCNSLDSVSDGVFFFKFNN